MDNNKRTIRIPNERGGFESFEECPNTFCPDCGHKGLWEDSMDDYYEGPGFWCLECATISHIGSIGITDAGLKKTLEDLKKATKG